MTRRLAAAWPLALVCAAVALLASAFLYGTPPDEEEFRFAVLSAWLRVRALAEGTYPYWVTRLGFGIPQPFIPHLGLHPLVPLLAVLTPVTWVRLLLLAHTVAGAAGMWTVCRHLQLRAAVGAVCTVTYLLAAPVQNYVLSDFWPSHFIVWTATPWILLLTWRILEGRWDRSWRAGAVLGLLTGMTLANTNPGHPTVYAPVALGVVVAYARAARRQWIAIAVALLIAGALAAPSAAHLVGERQLFPPGVGWANVPAPLAVSTAVADLWRPFRESEDTRILFFGAPFTLFALVGCFWLAAVRTDLVLACAIAALLLFTEWGPPLAISARYQFRDPLTLCGILLAGCVADRLWSRGRTRPLAAGALLLQVALVPAAAWPLIEQAWEPEGLRAAAYRGATGDAPLSNGLVAAMRSPGRLLYSPRVDHAVAERALVEDGVGLNALAYRDVAVVNGSFKAVSTDALWANDRLYYGWIRTPQALVDSDSSLDVLGIRYVLSYRGEQVASGLQEVWSGKSIRSDELVLFENSNAGPGAFLLGPNGTELALPKLDGCTHDRLLCRDVGALKTVLDRDVTAVIGNFNELRITWQPVAEPRTLIVTQMYRPAWTATSGNESLPTRAAYGGFIGVSIPPGVSSVRLRYRPSLVMAASVVCYGTLTVALLALAVTARRRPTARQRSTRTGKVVETP